MAKRHHNKQQPRSFIGVYISAARVQLLELAGNIESLRVASYATEVLPANAVSEHQIINPDAVGQAVTRALKKSGTRNRDAAIGVAGSAVISKTISVPAGLSDEEVEQQILIDAPQHIPYPIENVSLDFQVLGPEPDNAARNQVLLVACRRDNVEMRTAVLDIAKLRPRLVDVEEFALRNACTLLHAQMPNKGHGNTIAVFDMGAQQTQLNILDDRRSVYSQDISFGGQSLADELVDQQGLTGTEHLDSQLRGGKLKAADIEISVGDFCDQAAEQIHNALTIYFTAEAETDNIDHVLLTGACGLYPGFENQIKQRLSWPVACANPLRGVSSSRNARRNHVEHDGPSLMTAAGLSLRSIR